MVPYICLDYFFAAFLRIFLFRIFSPKIVLTKDALTPMTKGAYFFLSRFVQIRSIHHPSSARLPISQYCPLITSAIGFRPTAMHEAPQFRLLSNWGQPPSSTDRGGGIWRATTFIATILPIKMLIFIFFHFQRILRFIWQFFAQRFWSKQSP